MEKKAVGGVEEEEVAFNSVKMKKMLRGYAVDVYLRTQNDSALTKIRKNPL
jgi:hypothetical protein